MLKSISVLICLATSPNLFVASQNGVSKNRCVLPSYPRNGHYAVVGEPNAGPGQTFDTIVLNVSCNIGFLTIGKNILYCINGMWSEEVPQCVRSCRLEKHPSVTYRCFNTGNSSEAGLRDCNIAEPVGTIVKPECNIPIYYQTMGLQHMRCSNNGWNYIAVCKPECGKLTSNGMELVIGGQPVKRGEFPWHAGIYTKTATPYLQICGASLVTTTVVISAAHCFWNKLEERTFPASQFAVAVGKLYRAWGDPQDVDAQKSNVSEIKLPIRYQGARANFQDDIAVVVLITPIVYQMHVRPVCVDFDKIFDRKQLQPRITGKVAGWGLVAVNGPASQVLKVLDMPYVDLLKCIEEAPAGYKEYITSDKICAGTTDGKALCMGDSGGGLVFSDTDRGSQRFYLRGVVSTAPTSDDACNAFAITSFTQITAHASFIIDNTVHDDISIISGNQSPLCLLPPYPKNGRYIINGEPNAYPGQAFNAVQLKVTCDPGYGLEETQELFVFCNDGRWTGNIPRCVRICKLNKDPRIDYQCLANNDGGYRDCDHEESNGMSILVECKAPLYFSQKELPSMRCIDGNWDSHPMCYSDCGRVTSEPISENPSISRGELPWYAGIYLKPEEHYFLCGGTLISATLVISAAHCFWDSNTGLQPAEDYEVAVGKIYRDWNDPRDPDVQKSDVFDIKVPSGYGGRLGEQSYLENDIAILKLKTSIKFMRHVFPVCVDFDIRFDRKQLQHGNIGKAASWRTAAEEDSENVLKILNMAYLNIVACLREADPKYRKYISADKICGRRAGDTKTLCYADSGGGYVFPETTHGGVTRYYLRGVVSVPPVFPDRISCTENRSVGITQLLNHENFIKSNAYLH